MTTGTGLWLTHPNVTAPSVRRPNTVEWPALTTSRSDPNASVVKMEAGIPRRAIELTRSVCTPQLESESVASLVADRPTTEESLALIATGPPSQP